MREQLDVLPHTMLAGCTHQPVVELSERLAAAAPPGLGHAFYGSDGAAAVEIALKMSFHFWRNRGFPDKRGFVSLAGSYHGETLGALGVTDVALFRDVYAPLVSAGVVVPCPDARRNISVDAAATALDDHLARHHATTAALIVEPLVQGASGMTHAPRRTYLAACTCAVHGAPRRAADRRRDHDRLRTHRNAVRVGAGEGGSAGFPVPVEGLTGGYLPLSCVLTTDDVYAAFYADDVARGFLHSHSYTGNPLACRAALAVLDIFRDDDVVAANRERARRWSALLAPVAQHARVQNFRQRGMIFAWEVATTRGDFAAWCFGEALAAELLLRPIGNTLYLMPPYIVTDDEMALAAHRLCALLDRS